MLPDRRAQKIRNRGVLAGLVLEQNEPGWHKASKRHLSWLWNKVNTPHPTAVRVEDSSRLLQFAKVIFFSLFLQIGILYYLSSLPAHTTFTDLDNISSSQ